MKILSDMLGEIEVNEDELITFEDGIPGFEDQKSFILVEDEDETFPFKWMLSATNPYIGFVIIDPFKVFSDYEVELPDTAIRKLKIEDESDVLVYTICVIPEKNAQDMTTNLQGPIVINSRLGLGKQVILDDERYSVKHYILKKD